MATVPTRKLRVRPPLRRPTELEAEQAREALRLIDAARARVTVRDEEGIEAPAEIPPLALTLLTQILDELARGNGVTLGAIRPLLTPFEAANLLGVSLTYLTELLDSGDLPAQGSGEIRRVGFEDLMAYQQKTYEERSKVLDEMVALSQELGLY